MKPGPGSIAEQSQGDHSQELPGTLESGEVRDTGRGVGIATTSPFSRVGSPVLINNQNEGSTK